jgi:hypothetical protein
MVDPVEKFRQVDIHHVPVTGFDMLPVTPDGVMLRTFRPEAEAAA